MTNAVFCLLAPCPTGGVALAGMQACYVERLMLSDISLLNDWSCSLILRAFCSNGDSRDSTVSVAIAAVAMRSMPSTSDRINCSSSSIDTYTGVFLKSRSLQRFALPYRTICLPHAIRPRHALPMGGSFFWVSFRSLSRR
jgi:hypothetical protein